MKLKIIRTARWFCRYQAGYKQPRQLLAMIDVGQPGARPRRWHPDHYFSLRAFNSRVLKERYIQNRALLLKETKR